MTDQRKPETPRRQFEKRLHRQFGLKRSILRALSEIHYPEGT